MTDATTLDARSHNAEADGSPPQMAPELAARVAAFDSETVRLISEAEAEVAVAKSELVDAKEVAKAAQKAFDASVDSLRGLIRARARGLLEVKRGQQELPFGEAADTDDSWRSVSLGTLDLSPGVWSKLADAGLETVGALADFLAPSPSGHCKSLTDIPGIGESKREEIEAALDRFWASRAVDTIDVEIDDPDGDLPGDLDAELADAVREAEGMRDPADVDGSPGVVPMAKGGRGRKGSGG